MQIQNIDTATLTQLYEKADSSPIKIEMENELKVRSLTNNKYCKEDLFHLIKTLNKAVTVFLFPSSSSYKIIGNNVTIDLVLSQEEIKTFLLNQSSIPSIKTYGNLRIKVIARSEHTPEQIHILEEKGIETNEIYDVMHT